MDTKEIQYRFQNRILIIASAGLLLMCISVALISILPLYQKLKEQQLNNLFFEVKTKTMIVESFLDRARETASQVASRSKAREALEKYNHRTMSLSELQSFLQPVLLDALKSSDVAVGLSRLDQSGYEVIQLGIAVPESIQKNFNPADFSIPVIHELVTIQNKIYMIVSAPILNRQGTQVGTDVILFRTTRLREIVQDYGGFGKTGEMILGRMDAFGEANLFFPTRTLSGVVHDNQLSEHRISINKAFENLNNSVDVGSHPILYSENDLVTYGPIEGTDWGIVIRMAKAELYEPISKQVLIVGLIIGLIVIPLGVFGLLFLLHPVSNRMVLYVERLQEEMNAKEQAMDERIQVEKALVEEKERLSVTLRSIGEGVITTDVDGRIVLINNITENLTGWSENEATGKPVQKIFNTVNERTGQVCENLVDKVLTTGKAVSLTTNSVLIARDGTRYNIEDSGAPIFDQERKVIGTVLVYRDVTEEKRIAAEMDKVDKLESVGVLAGGIAHDFNNILAAILGNIELAQIASDSGSKANLILEDAKKATIRAKDLSQQLLTFAKGGDPVKQTASIGNIIIDSADFVLHGSSVVCHYNIPDELWNVDIDTGQISQVIQNVTINARRAMSAGGVIEVVCENISDITQESPALQPGNYIKISIADSGSGIPANDIDKIFDPFYSTSQNGSGLGLAICYSIISKHGGSISVQSEFGKGAVFTICLPASNHSLTEDAGVNQSVSQKEAAIPEVERKATVLIMDDDLMVRDTVKLMLEHSGHNVLLAVNGHEAISLYNESLETPRPIDVIIMDLTIPGNMGGKEAVQEILKINEKAKVIVASGYSNDPIMASYEDYGFKAAIAKPFRLEVLKDLINKTLG